MALQINKNLNFKYYREKRKIEKEKEVEDIVNKLKYEKQKTLKKQNSEKMFTPKFYFKVFKPSTMLKGQYKRYREKELLHKE